MTDKLSCVREGNVAVVTLDDGKANAMGFEMLSGINEILDNVEHDYEAMVLLGREGVLSGGFDLKVIQGGDGQEIQRLVTLGVKTIMRIYGFPLPVVTAATGHAVALGGFFLLASDYRFGVSGEFKIGLNETAIGLNLPKFGIELAKARLSPCYLTDATILAELYSPEDAIKVGFLDSVAEPSDVNAQALEIAVKYSAYERKVFEHNKLAFRSAMIDSVLQDLDA